jgi:hypothetical protein
MVCLLALCAPARALACKCAPPAAVADALHEAAAVFEGRVTKLTPLNSLELVVELSVTRSWKGAENEHILLRTRQDEAACGIPFAVDDGYLVYADSSPDGGPLPGLVALRCGRTKPTSEADEDLAALGVGVVPVSGSKGDLPPGPAARAASPAGREKPAAGGCASCDALGVNSGAPSGLIVLLGGFLLIGVRRRWRISSCRSRSRS